MTTTSHSLHKDEQAWCDHANDHIADSNCRHCGAPPEYCEFCGHVLDMHDYDIHNGCLGEWFGPGVKVGDPVFPYELMCIGCSVDRSPPPGTPHHDHFALKEIEQETHTCHIGPLPRWVRDPQRANSWLVTYDPPPPPLVETGSDSITTFKEVRFGE